MGRVPERRRHRWSGLRSRTVLGGTTVLSGVAALLVLLSPLASAHGTVTFSPPFTGFALSTANYTYASSCASEKQTALPTWTSANGTYQVGGQVIAGPCHGSQFAEIYSSVDLVSPSFATPAAGFGYVYATFASAVSAQAALHLGTASNGSYIYGSSDVSLVAGLYVYDVTLHNGSLFGYATSTIVSQLFYVNGSFSLRMGWTNTTMYATGTFAPKHMYQVQFEVSALIYASTYGGGSVAKASLNLAGSNGLAVSTIVAT
ncbi:MAG: hypothetical protein L3J91_06015 [Thermoplasmata archaeon]|nr:hypothetical protein [Thermoplasmata archaeon]